MKALPVPMSSHDIGRRLRKTGQDPKFWFVLTVLVPLVVWYGIFSLWALAQGVKLAFTTYHLINPALNRFVGLQNFQSVFSDSLFALSLGNSALWGIMCNFIGVPLCLGVALCLVSIKRGR